MVPRAGAGNTVHPHACGDNLEKRATKISFRGSPPRVWGQREGLSPERIGVRFTPTRVGTTKPQRSKLKFSAVHPHACGDNEGAAGAEREFGGSPPRVWGQRRICPPSRFNTSVHPHACGDNSNTQFDYFLINGSPPRVWGQPHVQHSPPKQQRFTPTRVGTTFRSLDSHARRSVHPHACGDNGRIRRRATNPVGSPPRVWGQHETRSDPG